MKPKLKQNWKNGGVKPLRENEVDFRRVLRYNCSIEMDKLINLFASVKVFSKLCTRLAYSCDEGIINSMLLEAIYYRKVCLFKLQVEAMP